MQLQQRSVTEIFSESMASEGDHKGCMEKQPKLTLFGMDLTERYSTFSLDQPVQGFGEQIPAKKLGHKMVPELENNRGPNFLLSNKEGSAFKSWSSAHGSERRNFVVSNADQGSASRSSSSAEGSESRIFRCRYCSRKFFNYKALGGHQKAHKEERTASKSNAGMNRLPTNFFQYPAVGQNPAHAIYASNGILLIQ